jgi:hypothetical protein
MTKQQCPNGDGEGRCKDGTECLHAKLHNITPICNEDLWQVGCPKCEEVKR